MAHLNVKTERFFSKVYSRSGTGAKSLVQSKLNCRVRLEVKPIRTHQQKGIKKVKKVSDSTK
jgi:hypothetical protein